MMQTLHTAYRTFFGKGDALYELIPFGGKEGTPFPARGNV